MSFKQMIDLSLPVNKVHWATNLPSFNAGFEALQAEYNRAYSSYDDKPANTTQDSADWLRVSALGKPLIVQAMLSPVGVEYASHFPSSAETVSEKVQLIFILGHFLEMWAMDFLKRQGWEVSNQQAEVNIHGVLGHIDGIITKDGVSYVVDIKSMNARYFEQVAKYGVDDSRGYLTQLACYSLGTALPPLMMCINKNTAEVSLVELDTTRMSAVQDSIRDRIYRLRGVQTVQDIYNLPRPPLVPEVFKKEETGRYRVHESLKYWEHRHLFYEFETVKNGYGKQTEYVVGEYDKPRSV